MWLGGNYIYDSTLNVLNLLPQYRAGNTTSPTEAKQTQQKINNSVVRIMYGRCQQQKCDSGKTTEKKMTTLPPPSFTARHKRVKSIEFEHIVVLHFLAHSIGKFSARACSFATGVGAPDLRLFAVVLKA